MQKDLSKRTIRTHVRKDLRGHRAAGSYIRLPDRRFSVLSFSMLKSAIAWSKVYKRKYQSERYDCDNFAYGLKDRVDMWCAGRSDMAYGPAFGFLWGRIGGVGHAVNWAVMDDGYLWLIEPQQKWKIWKPRRSDKRISIIAA